MEFQTRFATEQMAQDALKIKQKSMNSKMVDENEFFEKETRWERKELFYKKEVTKDSQRRCHELFLAITTL